MEQTDINERTNIWFQISDTSTETRLNPAPNLLDTENKKGELLDLIQFENHNQTKERIEYPVYMFTRVSEGPSKGNIMVNEIEYDTSISGMLNIYYKKENKEKSFTGRLQEILNTPKNKSLISSGITIKEILYSLEYNVSNKKNNTEKEKRIKNEIEHFSDRLGFLVVGIEESLFELLKKYKETLKHKTFYELAAKMNVMAQQQENEQEVRMGGR